MRPPGGVGLAAALLLVVPALVWTAPSPASADSASVVDHLPQKSRDLSAVWSGEHVFAFGGIDSPGNTHDEVWRYDPDTGEVRTMGARLPRARIAMSAVWTGEHAYLFGGIQRTTSGTPPSEAVNQIVRYDPSTDAMTVMTALLPTPRFGMGAFWDGQFAYLLGGSSCIPLCQTTNQILRYDPATDTILVLTSTVPNGAWGATAVWTGQDGYMFGGAQYPSMYEIVRFRPSTGAVELLATRLPIAATDVSSAWDGAHAYIFGPGDRIMRFTPPGSVVTMAALLPTARHSTAAVWADGHGYVLGGDQGVENELDDIVRYSLAPGPPLNVTATTGPGYDRIDLAWEAPAANTHSSPITAYQLYRSPASGGPFALLATLSGSARSHADSGLPEGATRYYQVRAVNAAGEGDLSPEVNATVRVHTTPGPPQDLAASRGSAAGEIDLTWQAPGDDGGHPVTGYKVYRSDTSGGPRTLVATLGSVLSHTDAGLPYDATRHYVVRAVNLLGEGSDSNEASATSPGVPDAPGNAVAVRGDAAGEVDLTWDAPGDDGGLPITGYKVYRSDASGGPYALRATLGDVHAHADTGIPAGATRYYVIAAVNEAGAGAQSSEASGTAPDVPSAPQGLAAARAGAVGQIVLAWEPPADTSGLAVTNYKVFRGATPGSAAFLTQLGAVTSFTDTGLPNGATRYYQVSAITAAGEGARSAEASATAPDVPGAPASTAAARGSAPGQIVVSWQPPSSDGGLSVTNYRLYRGTTSGSLAFLTQVGSALTFTDTGLPNGATRHYQVSAVNGAGEGIRGSEASAAAPDVPSAPPSPSTSRGPGAGQITLSWQAPSDNGGLAVTNYRIHRGLAPGGEVFLAQVGSVLTFMDSGLPAGATRYYQVSALNAAGEGALSGEASGTSPVAPSAPRNLAAQRGTSRGTLELSWQAPSDNGGIALTNAKVYRSDVAGGPYALVATLAGSATSHTDTGLPDGVWRYYKVSAVNAVGEGPQGNEASARTAAPPGPPRSPTATPSFSLSLNGLTPGGGMTVRWQAPSDDGGLPITAYVVKRVACGAEREFRLGNVTTFSDTSACLTGPNTYTITAINAIGNGPASPALCAYTNPWSSTLPPPGGRCP